MNYGKVHNAYWESETIDALSDRAALLGLFLISGPHRNAIGCFKLGVGAISDNPRFGNWGIEGVSEALAEMERRGFIVRDQRTGWTYVRNALKHDPVRGHKAAVHAVGLFLDIPENLSFHSELRDKLTSSIEAAKIEAKEWKNINGYPFDTPSIPLQSDIEPQPKAQPSPLPSPKPQPQPSPAQQPAPEPAAPREDFDARFESVRLKCSLILDRKVETWGRVNAWLREGADPEQEIYPILRARKPKWRSDSLEFFDGPIADAIAARSAKLPAARLIAAGEPQPPEALPPRTPEQRQAFLARFAAEIQRSHQKPAFVTAEDVADMIKAELLTPEQAQCAA